MLQRASPNPSLPAITMTLFDPDPNWAPYSIQELLFIIVPSPPSHYDLLLLMPYGHGHSGSGLLTKKLKGKAENVPEKH